MRKFGWAFVMVLAASSQVLASECVQFSGSYGVLDHGNWVQVAVSQTGCEKIDVVYDFGHNVLLTRPMILDGQKRRVPSFGTDSFESYESYRLLADSVEVEEESIWLETGARTRKKSRLYLDGSGALVEDTAFLGDEGETVGKSRVRFPRI